MYFSCKSLAALSLLAAGLASPAVASPDQSQTQTNISLGLNSFSPMGQSFTPTQNALDYVTFGFYQSTPSASMQVDLFEGDGFGGTLLGTSQAVSPAFSSGQALTTFRFASPVTLTPNSLYTFRIDPLAGDAGVFISASNPYGRGTAYFTGQQYTGYDLYFVEGTQSAPVPEASTTVSLGLLLALGGLAVAVKKKKANASA